MDDNGIHEAHEFMNDFWQFIKKYYNPKIGDHWFNAMCDEANEIAGRNNCPFAVPLLCQFIRYQANIVNELERQQEQEGKTA